MPDEFEDEPLTPRDHEALRQVGADALAYVSSVSDRPVAPSAVALAELAAFDEPLPESGAGVAGTLRLLADVGGPATMARIWCGPTVWSGETAMRISVSSWQTDLDDAQYAADVILDCAARIGR